MGEKYLSDIIEYDKDIAPYRIIRIYSGVGSGKSTWAEELAKEHNVLMITSRKNTADSQSRENGALRCSSSIDLEYLKQRNGVSEKRYIVCTNSTIEYFAREQYDAKNENTHIWKYFDLIILDEAHSLVADASYSNATFHVKQFLRWVQEHDTHCKLVFMTGTPEPIDDLFSEKTRQSNAYNSLNLFNLCRCVQPETVFLCPRSKIVDYMAEYLHNDGRIIYFASRIRHIETLIKELESHNISENDIGISYSKKERDSLFSKKLVAKKNKIDKDLTELGELPDDVKIFFTTAKNKEGINIKNKDIKVMVVESTQLDEFIQMAGRVRCGLGMLVIIYDANQSESWKNEFDYQVDKKCKLNINEVCEGYFNNCESKNDKFTIISRIEERFPFVRYDYFTSQFLVYSERIKQHHRASAGESLIYSTIQNWNTTYFNTDLSKSVCGGMEFQSWFPYSNIEVGIVKENNIDAKTAKRILQLYVEKSNYWGRTISVEERDSLKCELQTQLNRFSTDTCSVLGINKDFSSLASMLKKIGYTIADQGGKNDKNHKKLKIVPYIEE